MPHAESPPANGTMTNGATMTNGDAPHSKVLSHIQSYPVVHDSFEAYKSHPYGAKSLNLLLSTYQRFVVPLHPYLQTPYSYVSPYLVRADELGDDGLNKVDTQFPIVKTDTETVKRTVIDYAHLPLVLMTKGGEYVQGTWQSEYSKTQGSDGVLKSVKALVSTELKIGMDGYALVREYFEKGKQTASKKTGANDVKH